MNTILRVNHNLHSQVCKSLNQNSGYQDISFTGQFDKIVKEVASDVFVSNSTVMRKEGFLKKGFHTLRNLFRRSQVQEELPVLDQPLTTGVKSIFGDFLSKTSLTTDDHNQMLKRFKKFQRGEFTCGCEPNPGQVKHQVLKINAHADEIGSTMPRLQYSQELNNVTFKGESGYDALGRSAYAENFGYRNFDKQALGSNPVDGAGNPLGHHGDPSGLLSENNMLESGFEHLDSHAENIDGLASGAGLDEVAGPSTSGLDELVPHDIPGLDMPEIGEFPDIPEVEVPDFDFDVTDLI